MPATGRDETDASAISFADMRRMPLAEARRAIREGRYRGQTAGIGLGRLQGNLAILPADYALDFFRYCQRNSKPCPLVGVSDTGNPIMTTLGTDIDIRTDVPGYNVYRNGEFDGQVTDITGLWRDDLVAFVIGCSFTFEDALIAEGIRLRHIEENRTVSMYRTNLETVPAGPFSGAMVVSMRPLAVADVVRACEITARFPQAHGAPVHFGDPAAIGIADLERPDWGEPTEMRPGEIPVFWACGVTPQVAVRAARPPLCITHAPGRMLITDARSWDRDAGTTRARQT